MQKSYIGQKRSTAAVVVLSIVTCGIYGYYLYWNYSVDINELLGEKRIDVIPMLLLSIFCFPFLLYWLYTMHMALKDIAVLEDVSYRGNFGVWLIFTFLLGCGTLIAISQIQGALNSVWDKHTFE
jgi:hypothetical protein